MSTPAESNKRKLREPAPSPRPPKQTKPLGTQTVQFTPVAGAAGYFTNATLGHLLVIANDADNNVCNSKLDEVLACAYDEDIIRSALHLAGARITKWVTDRNGKGGDESKRRKVIARLKKRWFTKLLSHLVEAVGEDLDFKSKHHSLETYAVSGRFKVKVTVTPIFEIDDADDGDVVQEASTRRSKAPERDDTPNNDKNREILNVGHHEEEEYVPPSAVSMARRPLPMDRPIPWNRPLPSNRPLSFDQPLPLDHATHGNNVPRGLQPSMQPNGASGADSRSRVSSAFHSPPQTPPEDFVGNQLHNSRLLSFPTLDTPERLLILKTPKIRQKTLPPHENPIEEHIRQAITTADQGTIPAQDFIEIRAHYNINRLWVVRFRNEAAALRASGAIVSIGGKDSRLEPYNRKASKLFICNIPETVSVLTVTRALTLLFSDQAVGVKYASKTTNHRGRRRLHRTVALQLERASDLWSIVGRLPKMVGEPGLAHVQFNVWLDTTSCGICKEEFHQTFDCPQLRV